MTVVTGAGALTVVVGAIVGAPVAGPCSLAAASGLLVVVVAGGDVVVVDAVVVVVVGAVVVVVVVVGAMVVGGVVVGMVVEPTVWPGVWLACATAAVAIGTPRHIAITTTPRARSRNDKRPKSDVIKPFHPSAARRSTNGT